MFISIKNMLVLTSARGRLCVCMYPGINFLYVSVYLCEVGICVCVCVCVWKPVCAMKCNGDFKHVLYSRRSDSSVSLLSSCVPDLSLDGLAFYLDAARGKLHADGALALQVELISGEAGQQVTLPYT